MPTSAPVASRATRSPRPSRLAAFLLVAACAGCGGHARPRITVSPSRSLSTQPVAIRVTGVHGPVTLTLRSRDALGTTWTSTTRLQGNAVLGAFAIYRLAAPAKPDAAYIWSGTNSFRATVSQHGRVVAATTFTRTLGAGRYFDTTLAEQGFVGVYDAPRGNGRGPALLLLGGSEGGLHNGFLAASLAARGYPALAVAYFDAPGLPNHLDRIPLEYFERALRWLAAQPQVDPHQIVVLGVSRGSEAAQLLGLHYPKLVHGVVAVVPSNDANCAFPVCDGSAWTLGGKQVPLSRIPDERIRGPVLFICAEVDELWPSCGYAQAAMANMRQDPFPHELVVAPKSGHEVGSLIPYEPSPGSADPSSALNERGREVVWPKLLAFLRSLS